MPLVDSNSSTLWDGSATSLYRVWQGNGYVGYQRSAMNAYLGDNSWCADVLINALVAQGLVKGQRIALIGAGFGWIAERLVALGYGPMTDGTSNGRVCAVDTSTWIQSNTQGNANVTILNADVNASTGRTAIKNAFNLKGNATVDWAISEDVLPVLIGTTIGGNNEIQPFSSSMRQIATHVVHWITTLEGDLSNYDSRLNWKSLSDWKTWVTPDLVISRQTGTVL